MRQGTPDEHEAEIGAAANGDYRLVPQLAFALLLNPSLRQDRSCRRQIPLSAICTRVQRVQLGVTPPSEPNKKQKALSQSLSKLSGEAFDRKFVAEMIKDHKKEIAEYSKVARKQDNPAGAYAAQTLPTLQKHLETAQSLSKAARPR